MKQIINWRTFAILVAACVISSVLTVPYQANLAPGLADLGALLYISAFLNGVIFFSVATFLGLILAPKVGFELPILEQENKLATLKSILPVSVLWGLLAGIIIILCAIPFGNASLEIMAAELAVPVWARFLALFYGGIAEEVLLRLFVMSLFAWVLIKIKVPKNISIWAAIIISAVLFGIGHLPFTGTLTEITANIVARAIVLNGIGAIIFSLLYWKKGLESAMIAHFAAGIVLRFIAPPVAQLILLA